MLRLCWSQITRRRARTLTLISAIVVAAVSFSLLTSVVATSKLEVRGTIDENFRAAYDILVRPPGSRSELERHDDLVQQNYLSGIYGGITVEEYRRIASIDGVAVAAPIAMIGYVMPTLYPITSIDDLITGKRDQLFVIEHTWKSQRGLSSYPGQRTYLYFTRRPAAYQSGQVGPTLRLAAGAEHLAPCQEFYKRAKPPTSPFDEAALVDLSCFTSDPPAPGQPLDGLAHGRVGFGSMFPVPMLIAAIDPDAEAELVGLDDAMVAGRYLTAEDRTRRRGSQREVPVLMPNQPLAGSGLRIEIQQLVVNDPDEIPKRLAAEDARQWLENLPEKTLRVTSKTTADVYATLLEQYRKRQGPTGHVNYWAVGPVDYGRSTRGLLQPRARPPASPDTWLDYRIGYIAPPANADVAFRSLQGHTGSNNFSARGVYQSPDLQQVGVFDPEQIRGFSRLSQVPLATYHAPSARPADQRSRRLLDGRQLRPNSNLAGYLQQPPMMLTTLRSLPVFYDSDAFSNISAERRKAPLSVVRVRVAGVTGANEESRARVRLVAERIARSTGLEVDITIGSSPEPQLVRLPAGSFGRPALTLSEGWVSKGVAVRLLSAIDQKSAMVFALVLAVCALFLLNASMAAVRSRRSELGVLACLGWPARRIFSVLLLELLLIGLFAGIVGTVIALGITWLADWRTSAVQLALIAPIATLLAGLAGMPPAWRASRASPMDAVRPTAKPPHRPTRLRSIRRLAWAGLARWPGRTTLGATCMFLGVSALSVLLAVQTAFSGGIAGTRLGDFVAIQVRSVDYLAVGLAIGLAAFAVADIAYLGIIERRNEIGTMRAAGWKDSHIQHLFGLESLYIAVLGATAGGIAGVALVMLVLPIPFVTALGSVTLGVGLATLAAAAALIIPLLRLNRLAPATAISME